MNTFAIVGLGNLGAGIARRVIPAGFTVLGLDTDGVKMQNLQSIDGFQAVDCLAALRERLPRPRAVWLALPAGDATGDVIAELTTMLDVDDLIVDAGNSHFADTCERAAAISATEPQFVDVGISGGLLGERNGYCLMVGGNVHDVERLKPVLSALANNPPAGWARVGPSGAGHFAKMVHNGIEYGIMQALAEGSALLQDSVLQLEPNELFQLWNSGSLIEGTLTGLVAQLDLRHDTLADVLPVAHDLGTGRWLLNEAVQRGVPTPVLAAAVQTRIMSQDSKHVIPRTISILRNAFGGHPIPRLQSKP